MKSELGPTYMCLSEKGEEHWPGLVLTCIVHLRYSHQCRRSMQHRHFIFCYNRSNNSSFLQRAARLPVYYEFGDLREKMIRYVHQA